jgi:branched-chain amino acid transport system substrate-binding protein
MNFFGSEKKPKPCRSAPTLGTGPELTRSRPVDGLLTSPSTSILNTWKEKTISRVTYILILTGLCLALLFFIGDARAQEGGQIIKIGVPLPLSGTKSPFGDLHHKSYAMALEEINASGGVRQGRYAGYRLEFLFEDTRGMAETAREVTEELIFDKNVSILMGGYSSAVAFAMAKICEENRIPFISASGAADEITQQGWEFTFRVNPPLSDFISGLEDFLCNVDPPESMAIIYENTRFGVSTARTLKKWGEENLIAILALEPYEPWVGDFEDLLAMLSTSSADVLYVAANLRDSIVLVNQFAQVDVEVKLLVGSPGTFNTPEFIKGVGSRSENIVSSAVWIPNVNYPEARDFVRNYRVRYGNAPDYHGALAYAAAYVCRDVLERTASLEADDLLHALHTTNMMTVIGPVRFTSYRDFTNQNQLFTLVIQIQDGEFQTVWPPNAATADFANSFQNKEPRPVEDPRL